MTDNQLEFHLPAPPVSGDTPLIPARMVNEFVYCPRLAYLMWTQGEWAETSDTVEGNRVHARVDKPSAPLPAPQALETGEALAGDKIVSRSLTLSSATLGVIAKLDIAEADDGVVTPIDFVVAVTGTALTQAGRRRFVEAFERRLSQETTHPVFGYQVSMRRMLLVQARLLSRFLLGELPVYPHYLPR